MSYSSIAIALSAHQNWIAEVEHIYASWPEQSEILRAPGEFQHCEFGQWLEKNGRTIIDPEHFERIDGVHRKFHQAAASLIAELTAHGKGDAALAFIKQAKHCSSQLVSFLLLEKNLFEDKRVYTDEASDPAA